MRSLDSSHPFFLTEIVCKYFKWFQKQTIDQKTKYQLKMHAKFYICNNIVDEK